MTELKPCPFCDCKKVQFELYNETMGTVHCTECQAEGPEARGEKAAIREWNSQPHILKLNSLLETLADVYFYVSSPGDPQEKLRGVMGMLNEFAKYRKEEVKEEKSKEDITIPKDLDEAIEILKEHIHPTTLGRMVVGSEKGMAMYHSSLGQWLRNNWGFWTRDTPIYDYFHNKGLFHADDMSGVVLTSLWRHLNEKELKVEEQCEHYKQYWKDKGVTEEDVNGT